MTRVHDDLLYSLPCFQYPSLTDRHMDKNESIPQTVQGISREIGHLFFMAVLANSEKRVADFAFRCDLYINVPIDYHLNAQGAYPCSMFPHRG